MTAEMPGLSAGRAPGSSSLRTRSTALQALAVIVGIGWSILFVTDSLRHGLQMYGDGAIFSYAIAAQDAWAFHWHNIPGRVFTYLFACLPAQVFGALTGSARGAVDLYGLLFFSAPMLGLAATFMADRSERQVIFTYACASTAVLCPLVFGFPTETWMAHALFWPALALCHYARRGIAGTAGVAAALLALVFTHEGAIIFAVTIVATLFLRGLYGAASLRAAAALACVLTVWVGVEATAQPDPYFSAIFATAARHVFDVDILKSGIVVLVAAVLAGYGMLLLALRRRAPERAPIIAASLIAGALAAYWLGFDHAVHAENRYYLRTLVLMLTPAFGIVAAATAVASETHGEGFAGRALSLVRNRTVTRATFGALLLVTLVHAVETAKFVTAWDRYTQAVRNLASGLAADSALGDPRFVSAQRIDHRLDQLAWPSTIEFLSALVAPDFAPTRLVVDPRANYFWLACKTASENAAAANAIPAESRDLIARFSCLHR